MRQRELEEEDGQACVLDTSLNGDGDDASEWLFQEPRSHSSQQEAGVGETTGGNDEGEGDGVDDVKVGPHAEGEKEDDDEHEEGT